MKKVTLMTVLSLVFVAWQLFAGDHAHDHGAGPNGGVISEFGDLHAEGVKKGKSVGFYVLDANATKVTSVKKHSGGVLIVVPKSGKIQKTRIKSGSNFKKIMVPMRVMPKCCGLLSKLA